MAVEQTAFDALKSLAQLSLQKAQSLPEQQENQSHWSGVGFSLMGVDMAVPLGAISEMLEVPSLSQLPGVQSWVKGVANVRGRLLPVFDLAAFLGGSLTGRRKEQRLLVLESMGLYAGLWVDKVHGIKSFDLDARIESMPTTVIENLQQFLVGGFNQEQQDWYIFDLTRLANDERFQNVAAE